MPERLSKYRTISLSITDHKQLMTHRDKWVLEHGVQISLAKFIKMRLDAAK